MSEFNLQNALAAAAARRAENPPSEPPSLRLDPNSPSERIARARQQEQDIGEQLEWIQTQPDSEIKTVRIHQYFDRLGELAAEQGDYVRARDLSYSPERRDYYESIITAIEVPNDEVCACPPDTEVDALHRREFSSPAMMTVDQIVSPDGGTLNLKVCRKCGFKNAN